MVRILCLHGARASSDVTRLQLTALGLDALGLQLDCIEAPHASATGFDGSFAHGRSWQAVDLEHGGKALPAPDVLNQQLDDSLRLVIRHVREHGPYDGAYGFSQGASVVTLLCDEGVRRSLGCEQPLWDFVVLACGVDYLAAQRLAADAAPLRLPSLHILGEADMWREGNEALLRRFARPRVLRHAHGHELPLSLKAEQPELVAAVADFAWSPSPAEEAVTGGGGAPLGSVAMLGVLALLALACYWGLAAGREAPGSPSEAA